MLGLGTTNPRYAEVNPDRKKDLDFYCSMRSYREVTLHRFYPKQRRGKAVGAFHAKP